MKEQKNDDKKGIKSRYNIRFQNECIQVGLIN